MLFQAAFYYLSGVLPESDAMNLLKGAVERQYHHKGPKIIEKNHKGESSILLSVPCLHVPIIKTDFWFSLVKQEPPKCIVNI